ncbi:reverse transcriptase domain-containing protein [Tanacetum coccineum]
MPFGLCNAPAIFQRCMLAIFHDMIEESVKVFMNNFSVFGDSFYKCLNNLDKMLQRCKDAHLVLNWEKCHFMVKEGIVLQHKVSSVGLEVDKAKIDVISKLPPPTNIKGVRSFLGHASFYRRFIKDFSKIARPLTKLLEKDTPFEFNDECQKAFKILKEKLICALVILSPNWNLPFELMCDASDFPVGVVLEFDIEIKDRKGTENVTTDHLSRIKNDESSDDIEGDGNFPGETLMEINTKNEPWFADFANYFVADIIPKGMTYQQKNKFFSDLKHYFWEKPYLFKLLKHINDLDDDKSIDLEKTNDEETDDEFVHNKDEEMTDAEDVETGEDDEGITDAEKTEVTKGDLKQARKPPLISSSLSVSSSFGNQFLNLSSDTSLTGTLKEFADTEINSLLDIPIPQEVPHIQSPSIIIVPILVIPEPSVLSPIPEIPSVAPTTSLLPPSSVSTISPVLHQTTTLIPTPPITTEAPPVTTILDPLPVITQRVSSVETDVQELKEVDSKSTLLASLRSKIPSAVNAYLGSSLGDALQKVLQKHTEELKQQYSQQVDYKETTKKSMKSNVFNEVKNILPNLDDVIARGQADPEKILRERDRDDKDPSAGPNQGKKTKRSRTKESEPSKKSSTTKETSKDDIEQTVDDVVNDDDQPPDDITQTKDKAPKKNWLKQPPRPPTPDPE